LVEGFGVEFGKAKGAKVNACNWMHLTYDCWHTERLELEFGGRGHGWMLRRIELNRELDADLIDSEMSSRRTASAEVIRLNAARRLESFW
jgi:hypothetical protein